jgi:mRNA interferase HigB
MRIISKRTLIDFWTNTPEAKTALSAWHEEVSKVTWLTTQCFNICGNKYRLVVKINYATKIVYIRFITQLKHLQLLI